MDVTRPTSAYTSHDLFEVVSSDGLNRQRKFIDRSDFFGNYMGLSDVPEDAALSMDNGSAHFSESNETRENSHESQITLNNTDSSTNNTESQKSSAVLSIAYSLRETPRSISQDFSITSDFTVSDVSSPSNLAFQKRFISQYRLWSPVLKTLDGTVSEKLYRNKPNLEDVRRRSASFGSFSPYDKKSMLNDTSNSSESYHSQVSLLLPDSQTVSQKSTTRRRLSSINGRTLRNISDTSAGTDASLADSVPSLGCYCFVPNLYGTEPPSLSGHIAHLIGDKMYIYGGKCPTGISNEMYTLDCVTMKLRKVSVTCDENMIDRPKLAYSASTVVDNRFIYIFGGQNEKSEATTDFYVFDTKKSLMTMIPVTRKPTRRYGHSLVCGKGNVLYLFGGLESEENFLGDMWSVNVSEENNSQAEFQEMHGEQMDDLLRPQNRAFHSGHISQNENKLIIYGGSGAQSKVFEDIWLFDLEKLKWLKVEQTIIEKSDVRQARRAFNSIDVMRTLHSSCLIGKHLVIIGGHDGKQLVNTVAILSIDTHQWSIMNIYGVDMSGQCLHKMVYGDSRIFIVGGTNRTGLLPGIRLIEIPTGVFLENSL